MAHNFISALEREFGGKSLQITCTKSPSYISCFLPAEEIILIRKKASKKLPAALNDSESSHISDSEITGHPLEVQFATGNVTSSIMDAHECYEVQEEKSHLPLTLNQARECLNVCNLKLSSPYTVWVLTDGEDIQKTVLLSSFKSNGWITRSWAIYKGLIQEMPSLNSLQKSHMRLTYSQNPLVNCNVRSTYMIRSVSTKQIPQEFYSNTMLEASWNKLKINPPMDRNTEVTLITKCKIGNGCDGLLFLWRQLQLINHYVDVVLERSKHNCNDNSILLPSCQSYLAALNKNPSEERPITRIEKILKEPIRGHSNISNASLNEVINMVSSSDKPGIDVTDKLWYLLIECSSYQELSACFKQLFIEIKKLGTSAYFVSSSNISCLAHFLLGHGASNLLDPLEYLIEVGLDKFRKDILFIFSKTQIATLNSLNMPKLPKFTEIAMSDWLPAVQKWVSWCSQIYCVLELLWNTKEGIFFSDSHFLTLVSATLNKFTGPDTKIKNFESLIENPLQEIKADVSMLSIQHRLESSSPLRWVLTFSSELDGRKIQSVFYRGLHSPFPYVVGDLELSNLTLNTSVQDGFYWAELFSISDECNLCA